MENFYGNDIDRNDSESDEDIPEEQPMTLIVEDNPMDQEYLRQELAKINIDSRIASSVTEAIEVYKELTEKHIMIDVVFLDIILKDGELGTEFLRMIRTKKWMEKAMIIVMSGVEEMDVIKECHELKCQNFIHKPIKKNAFLNETCKILKHLETQKCPLKGYKTEKTLGSGASGFVELIRSKKTKQPYALKSVRVDPQGNYQKELSVMLSLKCPVILKLIKFKKIDDNLFLVLEYAEHGSLSHLINLNNNNKKKFDTELILDWMTELFIGLFDIHERNVMHRDIKSDNLLICKNNVLKIGDLGIARATENNKAITMCGTFHYRAPEVTHFKEYFNKVDIWSAGIVLYELIMLKVPFEGDSSEEILKKMDEMDFEPLPPCTDERLKNLLNYTLIYDPIKRLSAIDILRKEFMKSRVIRLFETKVIQDNELYSRLIEHMKRVPFSLPVPAPKKDEKSEDNENIKIFKTAIKLDSIVLKTSFKQSMFGAKIDNVVLGSDIEMFAEDYDVHKSDIQKLIDEKLLINVSNKDTQFDEAAYYQVKLYEEINVDNSITLPIPEKLIEEIKNNPINVSLTCLNSIIHIKNKIDEINDNDGENNKWNILFSDDYIDFLYSIKRLKYLRFDTYSSVQKLSTILNIYQTMLLHLQIKTSNYQKINGTGMMDMFKQVFSKSNQASGIVYEIGGQKLSLYEMKNIVIRRNKKPVDQYFRLVYDTDPRVKFIDENDSMLIKLHIVCLDPDEETDISFNPMPLNEKVYEQLDEYCKSFVSETVSRENELLNLPQLFKKYLVDFGGTEVELVGQVLKYHNDPNMKPTPMKKLLNSKDININYY